MNRFSSFIVHKRYAVLALFLAIIVFSVFSIGWVHLEEDITAYLSDDSDSKICLNISNKEFSEYGSAYLLVKDIEDETCHELVTSVEDMSNVAYTRSDIHASQHEGLSNLTLYVSFMTAPEDEESTATVNSLVDLVQPFENKYVYCEALEDVSTMIVEQMTVVMILIAVVVIVVLIFTSASFAEILVMLLVFIVSAIIGLGTNFLLGTISLISAAVSMALQLALSVDYAIILCDKYKDSHKTLPVKEAVIKALSSAVPEILASSLTTIAGLVALTLMEFRFGLDLGLVLIKSILASIFTVFLLMPVLLVFFGNLMDKTRHRNLIPKINFVGKFAFASRFIIPIIFVGAAAAGLVISGTCNFSFDASEAPSNRPSNNVIAFQKIQEESSTNLLQLLVPVGHYEDELALIDELSSYDEVKSVTGFGSIDAPAGHKMYDKINYVDFMEVASLDELSCQALFAYYSAECGDYRAFMASPSDYTVPVIDLLAFLRDNKDNPTLNLTPDQISQIDESLHLFTRVWSELRGPNYARILVQLNLPTEGQETFDFLDTIPTTAEKYFSEVYIAGNSVAARDFAVSFQSDKTTVSAVSIIFVVLILLLTFKSLTLPFLLIAIIQGSIWINFAIPSIPQNPVFFICYLIVSSIQMGSNIDYAIVISSRYMELRKTSNDKRQIIIDTVNFAFPTVITSALMMISAGFLVGYLVTEGVVAGFGYYIGTGTIVTLFLVLFVLPQLLLIGDTAVMKTVFSFPKLRSLRVPMRGITAACLILASLLILFVTPIGWKWASNSIHAQTSALKTKLQAVSDVSDDVASFEDSFADIDSTKYTFAESFLTYKEGNIQLSDGEEQLQNGSEQLAEGQKQYDEKYALYQDALNTLEAGQKELDDGQKEYDAGLLTYDSNKKKYEDGLAQYNAGLAQYNAGKIAYNEGLAAYESGLAQYNAGKAEYDAGLKKYNASKAEYNVALLKYNAITPIYCLIKLPYREYLALKQTYDAIVASGETPNALLTLRIAGYETFFETQLIGTGYSVTGLVAEYEAGDEQLADAKAQLSEAEAKLSAAEETLAVNKAKLDAAAAQLDASKSQLADAEAQLSASKKQLDDGKVQLTNGKAQLDDAKVQLENGRVELAEGQEQAAEAHAQLAAGKETLDENYQKLADAENKLNEGRLTLEENNQKLVSSLASLDAYEARKGELDTSIHALLDDSSSLISLSVEKDRSEICDALSLTYKEDIQSCNKSFIFALVSAILLVLSAMIGLVTVILWLRRGSGPVILAMASASFISALIGLVCYCIFCGIVYWFVLVSAVFFLICLVITLVHMNKQFQA